MWGEILSKEFYNRTIKIELLAPFSRIEIFAGKFLGIYLFNLVSFFSGLFLIQLINGICLYKYRGGLLKILFELVIFKELLLVFLLIFMITAFLGMIAAFASSIEMCIGLGVFLNFFQALMDAVIYALNMAGDISFKTYSYLKFSYLFSFGRVFDFLIDLSRKGAPVFDAQAMTHIYAVLVYSGLFFTAGFILFSRRE
jgi:ABC-type transport system involved in multi-copper enzyme maturation permease subunit